MAIRRNVTSAVPVVVVIAVIVATTVAGILIWSTPEPAIDSLSVSTSSLSGAGGPVDVTARVNHESACEITETPPNAVVTARTTCAAGVLTSNVVIARNPGSARSISILVTVRRGALSVTRTVRLTQTPQHGWVDVGQISRPKGYPTSISCVSRSFCMLVDGDGGAMVFDGRSWGVNHRIDADSNDLGSVSCPTTRFCVAVDLNGDAVIYRDGVWGHATLVDRAYDRSGGLGYLTGFSEVSCASASYCVALDEHGYAFTLVNGHWQPPQLIDRVAGDSFYAAVSCPAIGHCVVTDSSGRVAFLRSGRWTSFTPLWRNSTVAVSALSCVSLMFCLAIDTSGGAHTFNGTTWAALVQLQPDDGYLSCPAVATCVVLSQFRAQALVHGRWGHARKIDDSDPVNGVSGESVLRAISCVSATWCVAVDSDGRAVYLHGRSWSRPHWFDRQSGGSFNSVSCATSTSCVVSDSYGNVFTLRGTVWSRPVLADAVSSATQPSGVSCASRQFCALVDSGGRATTFNGRTWSPLRHVVTTANDGLAGVSCVSASFCVTEDYQGVVYWFNGHSWAKQKVVDPQALVTGSLTCHSSSSCYLVTSKSIARFDGSKWSATNYVNDGTTQAVSCPLVRRCVAITYEGTYSVFSGHTWSPPRRFDSATGQLGPNVLACASPSYCVAFDQAGRLFELNGVSWSGPRSIGLAPTGSVTAASCVSVTFCVAVTSDGEILERT